MADPMAVACPHCGQLAGQRCANISDWARKPHAARVDAAETLDAPQDVCPKCGTAGCLEDKALDF